MQFSNQYGIPQYQNPYLDMQNQFLRPTQIPVPNQQSPFYGKIVESFDSVTANDVPMNGQPATFIKNDGSEIQIRVWTPQGTIATTRYMPYTEPRNENTENITGTNIDSLYDDFRSFKETVLSRFDRLDKSVSAKSNSGSRNKREVESDE